jgi:hypothetical protein
VSRYWWFYELKYTHINRSRKHGSQTASYRNIGFMRLCNFLFSVQLQIWKLIPSSFSLLSFTAVHENKSLQLSKAPNRPIWDFNLTVLCPVHHLVSWGWTPQHQIFALLVYSLPVSITSAITNWESVFLSVLLRDQT